MERDSRMGQGEDSARSIDQPSGSGARHECPGGLLGIVSSADGRHLIALRTIAAGHSVLWIDGDITTEPSRHSVQLGPRAHIVPAADTAGGNALDHAFWRYLNHSCEPNAWLRGRELIARRDIEPNEEVSFDYNSTEWDMAEPFECHCGSARCLGTIRGFRHLSPAQRERLQATTPALPAHLASAQV